MDNYERTPDHFSTPEEEIKYLRNRVAEQERKLFENGPSIERAETVRNILAEHEDAGIKVASEEMKPTKESIDRIVLDIDPEQHDATMGQLIEIINTKGVLSALAVVRQMRNPHIADDFHRFLVAYISAGLPSQGTERETRIWKAVNQVLFEIILPTSVKEGSEKTIKDVAQAMEQFYAGMLSISASGDESFAIELANPQGTAEFVFYASVPRKYADLFEKQLLSIFPTAIIVPQRNDYNIFVEEGVSVGSQMYLKENAVLPIKISEQFSYDPLNIILNALSKLKDVGEGAAIQFVINPTDNRYIKAYRHALEEIEKGKKPKEVMDIRFGLMGNIAKDLKDLAKDIVKTASESSKQDENNLEKKQSNSILIEHITQKIKTVIVESSVRIVASAENRSRAETILSEIEASFNQFAVSTANAPLFKRVKDKASDLFFEDFSYRIPLPQNSRLPLNLSELSAMMHLPERTDAVAPNVRKNRTAVAPAPIGLSDEGVTLGTNNFRGTETIIKMAEQDRMRHMYVIGQTGTGKTTLLKNTIIQDIQNGDGVCMIDPHGYDIHDILAQIPPERYEDVIYFDPSDTERPMALNMLEYDYSKPDQKIFVVNELFSIFQKLYSAVPESMGPMFEQYFRNAAMLVIEDPESGSTLLDVSRILTDKEFRQMKLSRCINPVISQFWREVAEKAGGEASLANIVPYITSKFDVFLANDIMRPIIAQQKSSLDFRHIMDTKKILLVNLSKGRLGDINSSLIGLIIVGKILMAALSRVDMLGSGEMAPFYLYIDEFQNVTTPSISTILSEIRKYKVSLTIAHQFIAQLDQGIKDSVFGNVGSMAVFRVGIEDAEFLQKQFEPVFTASDIMNLENYNACMRILAKGTPARPFSMRLLKPTHGDDRKVALIKELSRLKYGRPRDEVERDINNRYR